jgi:serine/threonine-protein kinase
VVKLSDFGIAKVFASTHLTVAGGVIGTPEYLSPEQATGKQATPRSDLYSLGVVLYTMLTGKPPFEGETVVDLLHKHRYAQVEKPSHLSIGLPHDFEAIVLQLLEKDPSKRPADGMVLYKQLDRLRGKYQRKAQETMAGLPPPPVDSPLVDSRPPGEEAAFQGPGPATLMAELMREELEKEKSGGPVNRALNRWWVLVPLLVVSVGLIVWNLWPPSAATLFQRGSALMASDNPDDWERGWTEYLERLERDHPGHAYKDEVDGFRKQYEDHVALKEAERAARDAERSARKAGLRTETSEAQWFYLEGQRLRRQGNKLEAERVWRDLIAAFREVDSEKPWVALAERELKRSPDSQPVEDTRWASVRQALNKARQLRDNNRRAEAEAVWNSLEGLYKNDPSAGPILDEIRKDRSL